ncbi:hypothetical protein DHEL01_v213111 [Diaporthe helianthi]|uniref:Uncharacterized protein n=1 Tax=Diaporthe helianthi TaxID=158607 RepID=A0A2P5HE06_DIAHE|nr:hypothetical protein DHEL01_v213111 [Diaporthe helianthi]
MLFKQTIPLILATLAAVVTSSPGSQAAFRITLTNTTLGESMSYEVSANENTFVDDATSTFDHARLDCLHQVCLPEFHCILQDKNNSRTVDLGPGTTGVVCAIQVGLITCGWQLPDYDNECRAKPGAINLTATA